MTMKPPQPITSAANPRLRAAVRLRDSRGRKKQGRFLVDGVRDFSRAVAGGLVPEEIYWDAGHDRPPPECLDRFADRIFSLPTPLMQTLAYGERASELVGVFPRLSRGLDQLTIGDSPLIVVLDGIEKPGNIGAVFRTADAVGADAVLLSDCLSDPCNPNAIRSSCGTVFSIPWAADSAVRIHAFLRQRQIRVHATRVDAELLYSACDWTGGVAMVIGNEAEGINDAWRTPETQGVRIPMLGIADSLNASITAAVCLYEAVRQRS
jgi:TrmH family RNA methyltransferase